MSIDVKGNIISSTDITNVGVFKSSIVRDGLICYLDAGNQDSYPGSGTAWYDLTGNGNTGTLTNGPTFNSSNGGSIVFDGTNYVIVAHSTSLNISEKLTASNWIYYSSGNGRIMQKDSASYTRLWETGGYSGTYRMEIWHSDGAATISYGNSLTVNGWMNLTMTFDGTNVIMYQNGILITTGGSFVGNIRTDITPLYIGGMWGASEFFFGRIATASVYNRALNSYEIAENFQAQRGRFGI